MVDRSGGLGTWLVRCLTIVGCFPAYSLGVEVDQFDWPLIYGVGLDRCLWIWGCFNTSKIHVCSKDQDPFPLWIFIGHYKYKSCGHGPFGGDGPIATELMAKWDSIGLNLVRMSRTGWKVVDLSLDM
ncbi:unnamed protein product [Vicia faba]|uniref:Uncharacterized protein n=1 Tax=Vicia faba TaxID=3906 RepID=A0AAV0Z355_VICFA|nr:unnamed protein product [Vicia faba]